MRHEELVEEFTRETRYRGVLVVSVVIGILASAIVGIAFALGGIELEHHPSYGGYRNPAGFAFFAIPFAVSILVGGGIYHALCFYGRRRARKARR